jgi:hypothetical protein
MRTLHITTYAELRIVDHRAVIAWERIMREIGKPGLRDERRWGGPTPDQNRILAAS